MRNLFYLLNMRVSGVKNLKEEVCLNFYKKTVDKNFDPEKYRVKAIYGENGVGKSALITAVKIFHDLIINDNYLNESSTRVFLDEIINKETHTFKFECDFLVNFVNGKRVYNYSVQIGKDEKGLYEIQNEILKTRKGNYKNNNYQIVFESKNGELLNISCPDEQEEVVRRKSINLLASNSFVYLYITDIMKDLGYETDFSFHITLCISFVLALRVYLGEEDQHELYFLKKRIKESGLENHELGDTFSEFEESLSTFSNVSDRIVDKKHYEVYKSKINRLTQFIKIFKPDLVSIDIDAKENGNQYVCDLNLNYGEYKVNKEFESTGIKKLIRLFDCFLFASTIGIVFIDELDSNLNDVYLCKLIEYFMYYGKGQICFTTHNLSPMSILKENKNSIDFLSSDNHLVSWTARGNASPENCYKNGMIEDVPFNIDATDFIGIFGE